MSAEPPPEPSPSPSPKGPPPAPFQGYLRDKWQELQVVARQERDIRAPTPLTLRLLGVVFAATLLPWVAAKSGCNLRDSPVRQPHDPPTATLAKNAKSAALELAQRAAMGRYREAAELARGDVAQELLAADARCTTDPAPCERRRSRSAHVFTRAVVASRGPLEASVRTESQVGSDPPERFALHVTQEGGQWYVVRRAPLDGPIDAPVSPDEMVSPIAIRPSSGPLDMSIDPQAVSPHGVSPHGTTPGGPAPSSGSGTP